MTSPAPNTQSLNVRASFESFSVRLIHSTRRYAAMDFKFYLLNFLSNRLSNWKQSVSRFFFVQNRWKVFWSHCWTGTKFRWMEAPTTLCRSRYCFCSPSWSGSRVNKVPFRQKLTFRLWVPFSTLQRNSTAAFFYLLFFVALAGSNGEGIHVAS